MTKNGTQMLSKSAILASRQAMRTQLVEVPEWSGSVMIRELSASGAAEHAQYAMTIKNGEIVTKPGTTMPIMSAKRLAERDIALVSMSIITEDGDLMFGPADVAALADLSEAGLQRVVNAVKELNGMGEDEATVKKLLGMATVDSPTD